MNYVAILITLIIYFLVISYFDNFRIIKELKGMLIQQQYLKSFIYFFIYFFSLFSIIILLNSNSEIIKIFSYIFLFITLTTDNVYLAIDAKKGFSYEDALNIYYLTATKTGGEAVSSYQNIIIKSGIRVVLGLFILYLCNYFILKEEFSLWYLIFPLLSFIFVYVMIHFSTANRLAYPSLQKIIDLIIYAHNNKLYNGPREKVNIKKNFSNDFNIVFIVDESIRGDKLQINGFDKETTPFLYENRDFLFNYGVASSGGVCSNYSQALLLTGIQSDNLPDKDSKLRKIPTIFQYAKEAGYETYFFNLEISPKNDAFFLMEKDYNIIDAKIDLSKQCKLKFYERDFCALNHLEKLLQAKQKSFTYLVKYGSHFHYEITYPEKYTFFEPTLHSNEWDFNSISKDKFLNSYYNSLRWNVDFYWEELFKKFKNSNTIIIYTSDHGNNLMENMDLKQTHCAKGAAPKEMAKVPFFIAPMNENTKNFLDKLYLDKNYNKVSHFNIFGSLLYLMGYSKEEINKMYGLTIFDDLSEQKRVYTSGDIFGRSKMFKNLMDDE